MRISDWSSDVCSSDLLDAWDWPAHRSLLGDAELLVKLQRPGNDRAAEFSGAIGPDGNDPVPLQQLVFEFARDRGAAAVEIFDAGQTRSEGRREGNECVRTLRSRLAGKHIKKKN